MQSTEEYEVLKYCMGCKTIYNTLRRRGDHVCGEKYCCVCESYKPQNHLCFMVKDKIKTKPDDTKFLYKFFDFECSQEEPLNERLDTPNYCVAQQICHSCKVNDNTEEDCVTCGVRERTFSGANTLKDFMSYLMKHRPELSKIISLALNMKSYGGQFVLKDMLEDIKCQPEVIMSGFKNPSNSA